MEAEKLKASLVRKLKKFDWVPHADRVEVALNMQVSRPTIDNYINGKVGDMIFAERLIAALSKVSKIKKRKTKAPTT